MSNNIIVLSSDDEGDNPIDPWVSYSSNADNYSVKKNYVSPKSLLKNDPFQIGLRYTTPLMVTPFKDDQTKYGNSPICVMDSVREGLKTTSPTVSPYKQTIIHGEEGQCTTSSLSIKSTNIHANEQKNDMLNVGEGINTTSPTVIQKVPRQKELEKFQSTTSFRTPESVKNNYSYVNKEKGQHFI